MIVCIYTITNKVNGKMYVGKTNHFYSRKSKHKRALQDNRHINEHLQRAWNKYGEENFAFEVLEECCAEHLMSQEHYWCNMLGTFDYNIGYNIRPTHPFNKAGNSPEMLEKVRKALTGKKLSVEHRLKLSLAKQGRTLPEETRQRMSAAAKGKPKSETARANIAKSKTGSGNPMFGKPAWNRKPRAETDEGLGIL